VFAGQVLTTINHARTTCSTIAAWQGQDTLEQRAVPIQTIIESHLTAAEAARWQEFCDELPPRLTLEELRDFLWADTDEQQAAVLESAMSRLGLEIPEQGPLPPRVRIMTMHGAKGLSGRVVFIPGLEEQIFPGPWRQPYPGLVLEAARLLYVSITRARASCIMTFAGRRMVNGAMVKPTPSRFATQLGGAFAYRDTGLTDQEASRIMADCANL
jgi:superfamily I DNA/RNA helicase